MVFATPKEVMEAVFDKKQISVILTVYRNDRHAHHCTNEEKEEKAKEWFVKPTGFDDLCFYIEYLRKQSKAKCMQSSGKWILALKQSLLVTKVLPERVEANNKRVKVLQAKLNELREGTKQAAELDDRLRHSSYALTTVEFPEDEMPDDMMYDLICLKKI